MTSTVRLGGLTLSAFLHVGAILALLSWSGSEWAHPLFVDLLERTEQPSGPAGQGEPAEPARGVATPPGRTAREDSGAPRGAHAPARPVTPPPEAVAPAPSPPPSPVDAATPTPPTPPPVPEPERSVAASGESAASPAAPTAAPSAPVAGSEQAGSSSGSRQTDASGGETAPGATGSGGSPLARTAPGGGGGAVPGEYGPYLARFRQRVQEALVYPLAARRQGAQGTVELDVWIEASGRVRDVRVVRSSTNPLLDDAALETIRRLGPVPFPESLPRRPLLIRLPLVFQLR